MTIWAQVKAGAPKPITLKGGEWVDDNGVTHPRNALKDASFRAAHGIVEILPAQYDQRTHNASGVTGYTDNGDGTWSEQRTITLRSVDIIKGQIIEKIKNKHRQVCAGGMIHAGNNFPTDDETRQNVSGLVASIAGGRPGRTKEIASLDGAFIPMTPVEFKAYADQLADHCEDSYDVMVSHIKAASQLADPQAILDYNFTTGWPDNPAPIDEV